MKDDQVTQAMDAWCGTGKTLFKLAFLWLLATAFLTTSVSIVAAAPLQGKIERSRKIKPVEARLMPGQLLTPQTAPELTPTNDWCMIPDWFAGTWQFTSMRYEYLIDHRTGQEFGPGADQREVFQQSYGTLRDRAGNIWHYLKTPYSYRSEGSKTWTLNRALSIQMEADHTVVVRHVLGTRTDVSARTDRILTTSQLDCVNRYKPDDDGVVHLSSLVRQYDEFGNPTTSGEAKQTIRRVKPFEEVEPTGAQDLRVLFSIFLAAHGKSELIPLDVPPSTAK